RADHEGHERLEQRDPEMPVDGARRKPVPNALEHLERLAEEEGRLVGVVKVERRQQRRARADVPDHEHRSEEAELPPAQAPTDSGGHSSSTLRPSWRARSGYGAR